MATILIAGGTGLVGQRLSILLEKKGHQVIHLSRTKNLDARFPAYHWDLKKRIVEKEAIEKANYIINLTGAGIADGRWTEKRKHLIIDSRVNSTLLLLNTIQSYGNPIGYLSASAVGFYGDRGDQLLKEEEPPDQEGFLSECCIAWENAIQKVEHAGIPTSILRIGIVLSTQGGAFEKMRLSYKVRLASYLGDGTQYYSWIHLDDLCRMFIHVLENNLTGVYNAVGPDPVTNKTFTEAIAKAMDKKVLIIPTPATILRLTLGEMADTVLYSTKVASEKIEKTGFRFEFPQLIPALKDLLERKV